MATLTGNSINTSYQGLLKTSDNAALDPTTLKQLTDGTGASAPLELSQAEVKFTNLVDFTSATVTGLPADVNTTYDLDSIQTGSNVAVTLVGSDTSVDTLTLVAGTNMTITDDGSNNITLDATDTNTQGLVNGTGNDSLQSDSSLTGTAADASGSRAIALGNGALAPSLNGIAIGRSSNASAFANGLAFGAFATASADGSVALGQGVTAAIDNTVSVKALEVQTDSTPTQGGIIMSDAGGTDRRLNIDASGGLQIDSTPVGGGAAGLESGSGTDSMQSASSLTTNAANASGNVSIALGDNASAVAEDTISIGTGASATSNSNIAIGNGASASGDTAFTRRNIAIGENASAANENALAVGAGANASSATSTALGFNAAATGLRGLAAGLQAAASAFSSTALGNYVTASQEGAIAIGGYSTNASAVDAIAIGKQTVANATGAIALGAGVTASIADTLSAKAIELQTDSTPTAGGIIMSDAGGTDRRINIDTNGNLQVDSNPVLTQTNSFATGGYTGAIQGYGATYWSACSLTVGRPSIAGSMPDQGANVAMVVPFDIDYTKTVTTIGIPMPVVTGADTVYIGIYEGTADGGPGTQVVSESKAISASDNDTWVELTLASTFTPEIGKSYWIAAMTPGGSSASALAYVSGEAGTWGRFTTTNNSAVGTMISVQTLRVNTSGSLPSDFSTTTFSHRD